MTLLIGVSKGMACLIPGPITTSLGVQLLPIFRGRVFGKLRSLGGWHFVWIAVHGQILTLDNLMLRGRILVNRCCMCHRNEETVDHLLLHCPVAHSLWVYMFQIFGTQWVMPGFVERLVYCWSFWLGKFNSDIWNMVPGCLMWFVWTERNRCSFEDTEKSLVQLQALCQKTLFD